MEIQISPRNTQELKSLKNQISSIQDRMKLILTIIINQENLEGDYSLSDDFEKLILVDDK